MRRSIIAVCILVSLFSLLAQPARADRPAAAGAINKVFLPIVVASQRPIGLVAAPVELKATAAQASLGIEPGSSAVETLLRAADDALAEAPCAVVTYTTSSGASCLNRSSEAIYVLAMAYWVTDDRRYSDSAAAMLRAWYTTLAAIDAGDDQAQLDWSRLAPAMIWGADLLDGTVSWMPADRQQFTAMLTSKVLLKGQEASSRTNNWADAGNLLRLTIAVYANLPDERAAVIANWKLKLDGVRQPNGAWVYGMLPDGSIAEENRRGDDGLSYNQGALSLKTVFAEILRRQGDGSLYAYRTPRGVGLKNGWDFLAPQVVNANNNVCSWPYTTDRCVRYANRSGWEIAYAYWHNSAYLGPIMLNRPYRWSDWSDPGYSTLLFGNLNLGS